MLSFDHFRNPRHSYQPRTPAAALRAVTEGFAEIEELVYQGTSLKPLVEEPFELMELQRILSRPELDFGTGLLLVRVFTLMLGDPDPERALFAAEGITTIETRYAKHIDELKGQLGQLESAPVRLELARRYYEFALLNEKSSSIRSFYLREAFLCLRESINVPSLSPEVLSVAVRILEALGLYDQADSVLKRACEKTDPEVLFLRAEIAFRQGDYSTVSVIARHLAPSYNRLRAEIRSAIDQWCGERETEA